MPHRHRPTQQPSKTAQAHRPWRLGALCAGLLWLALPPLAVGCGESTTTNKALADTPSTTAAQTATATQAATAPQAASTTPATPSASDTQSTPGKASTPKTPRRSVLQSLGNAKPARRLSEAERLKLPVNDIVLSSPTLAGGLALPSENTCDGSDQTPALSWKNIPSGTAELVIFAISTQPVDGKLFFDWALSGISPTLQGIQAGQLPAGVVVARNSAGQVAYTICPPAGSQETYAFSIYALPRKLPQARGFEPALLRTEARRTARHIGLLLATYKRS